MHIERALFGGNTESAIVSCTVPANAVKVRQLANDKFRRDRHFSTRLASHGFSTDTSMQRATQAVERRRSKLDHVSGGMNGIITQFYTKVSEIVAIQRQLLTMQQNMTRMAIEMLSARRIQHMIRGWMARHLLWKLRVARFIRDRVRFRMHYKRRVRAVNNIRIRVLIFLARRLFKIHMRRNLAAQRIQKLFLKYRLYHRARYRCVILGKVGRLLKHVELFGMRRAIMYMRRGEVKRVQRAEQALYAQILAYEREKAIVEEEAAAVRAAEALKADAEVKEVARLRLEQAKRKQQQKATAAATGTTAPAAMKTSATKKSKSKPTRSPAPTVATEAAPAKASLQSVAGSSSSVAPVATVECGTMAGDKASEAPIERKNSQPTVAVSAIATVAERPLDRNAVWLAHSLGITAGQASLDAMYRFIENRYSSVYGGFYGEYCCVQDNRENSFAAVRFRFMLRCFRKRRLKALAGPHAKAFFYMLSHLNNTPSERRSNKVVQWLQAATRLQAAQRAEATASAASFRATTATVAASGRGTFGPSNCGASGKTLGKTLLNSLQRTRTEASASISEETATLASPDGTRATMNRPLKAGNTADDDGGGTFLTAMTTSAKQTGPNSPSPTKTRNTAVAPTFPIYTAENFPRSFVTGCYRPRTFAELIVMLCDLRRAVLKAPSLVDDSEPPNSRATAAGKSTASAKGAALLSAMIRSKKTKEMPVLTSAKEKDRDKEPSGKDRDRSKEVAPAAKETGHSAATHKESEAPSIVVPSTVGAATSSSDVTTASVHGAHPESRSQGKATTASAPPVPSKKIAADLRGQFKRTASGTIDKSAGPAAQMVAAESPDPSPPVTAQAELTVKEAKKKKVAATSVTLQPPKAEANQTAARVDVTNFTAHTVTSTAPTIVSTVGVPLPATAAVNTAPKQVPHAVAHCSAARHHGQSSSEAAADGSDDSTEPPSNRASSTHSVVDSRIPAQLRSHGRTLRERQGTTTSGLIATPPTATAVPSVNSPSGGGGNTSTSVATPAVSAVPAGVDKSAVRWSTRAVAIESRDESTNPRHSGGLDFPPMDRDRDSPRYTMSTVQSVPPSAIIAAARESVRQAEIVRNASASGSAALHSSSGGGSVRGDGGDCTSTASPTALLRRLAKRPAPG